MIRYFVCSALLFADVLVASDLTDDPDSRTDPEITFAHRGDVVITQKTMDAAFANIPEKDRLPFIRDGAKVQNLLNSLLQTRDIAVDARKHGFENDPLVAERMRMAAEEVLARAWLEEVLATAPEPDYEALAWEDYVASPEKYRSEEMVSVTQLLVGTEARSRPEAEELANQLYQQIESNPESFDEMVLEHSDDPAKLRNMGRYEYTPRGRMVKPFEDAAFAMREPGTISAPVETQFGFHIIRLDTYHAPEVKPFEKVKEEALDNARRSFLADYQLKYLRRLALEPVTLVPGAVEVMARRYFGDDLEKAPFKN